MCLCSTYFLPPPLPLPITRPNPAPRGYYRCQKYKLSPPRHYCDKEKSRLELKYKQLKSWESLKKEIYVYHVKSVKIAMKNPGAFHIDKKSANSGFPTRNYSNPNESRVRNPLFADFLNMKYSPIFRGNFGGFSVLHMDFRRVPKNPNF
jgi:hypothetical protein